MEKGRERIDRDRESESGGGIKGRGRTAHVGMVGIAGDT